MSTLPSNINLKVGDSFSKVAQEVLGDYSQWRELATFNNIDIFKAIEVGRTLTVPTKEEAERRFKNTAAEQLLGVDRIIEEIITSRQATVISKLLGVDQTQLLKDLDLSGLAKGLQNPTTAERLRKALKSSSYQSEVPVWQLLEWVL